MAKVAMFGLGNMGFPIASCLLGKGHELVTAIHSDSAKADRFTAIGGKVAEDNYAAVKDAEYIISCVPNDDAMINLLLDPKMIEAVQPGQVIIEMSTTKAASVKEVAAPYLAKGVKFIDAPLTGQPVHAYKGQITLLCGSEKETFDEAQQFMSELSKGQWYVGDVGAGKVAKLCNNLLTAANKLMIGEMAKIIKANGVDPKGFQNVISTSPNHNEQFDLVWNLVTVDDFAPRFALRLMRKDVRLAMELADGLDCDLFEEVYKIYRRATPYDELDANAVVKAEDLPV